LLRFGDGSPNRTVIIMDSEIGIRLIKKGKVYCPRCGYEGWLNRRKDGYYRVTHSSNKHCYIGSLRDTARILANLGYPDLLDEPNLDNYGAALLARLVTEVRRMKDELSTIHKYMKSNQKRWRHFALCPHCNDRVRIWFEYRGYVPATSHYSHISLYPLTERRENDITRLSFVNVRCVSDLCPNCRQPVLIVVPHVGSCEVYLGTGRIY
jgi:5-methylcytosine-specific restriction endonuclease McrA